MILLPFIAAAAVNAVAFPVTLDELRAHPGAMSGRAVRVSGQLDECWNMSCHLCPTEATPANPEWSRCLAISLDRFRGGDRNVGANVDSAFRYADVVVTARFDPACLQNPCTDRASVLLDARVEDVTRRRRSRDGLVAHPDPLFPVADAAAAPLLAIAGPGDPREPTRVFAVQDDRELRQEAIVCHAMPIGGGNAEWPASWQGAISSRSTEDHYRCLVARRAAGGWRIEPR